MFIVANSLGISAVCRPDVTRWARWAWTIEISIYLIFGLLKYRGSPTYTKITNTVSTNTFFGLCTCKWGN